MNSLHSHVLVDCLERKLILGDCIHVESPSVITTTTTGTGTGTFTGGSGTGGTRKHSGVTCTDCTGTGVTAGGGVEATCNDEALPQVQVLQIQVQMPLQVQVEV